jgi:hypothetical protein
MNSDDLTYLIRAGLGLVVGVSSGILGLYFLYSILFSAAVYALSLLLFRILFMGAGALNRRALLTTGAGSYVFIWLTSWILFYNMFH